MAVVAPVGEPRPAAGPGERRAAQPRPLRHRSGAHVVRAHGVPAGRRRVLQVQPGRSHHQLRPQERLVRADGGDGPQRAGAAGLREAELHVPRRTRLPQRRARRPPPVRRLGRHPAPGGQAPTRNTAPGRRPDRPLHHLPGGSAGHGRARRCPSLVGRLCGADGTAGPARLSGPRHRPGTPPPERPHLLGRRGHARPRGLPRPGRDEAHRGPLGHGPPAAPRGRGTHLLPRPRLEPRRVLPRRQPPDRDRRRDRRPAPPPRTDALADAEGAHLRP